MKLPPDVKAAAKRQVKGLKRIPSKAWTVLQTIVFDNPQYKKALDVMADLGVTDVLAEMMQSNKQFRSTLGKYSQGRGLAYMFDLMDVGIPVDEPLKFLDADQRKRLREVTTGMDRDDAMAYLEALKNPGKVYDRKFIPTLANSLGYGGKQMRNFMQVVIPIGREALLRDPSLMDNSSALMREVEQAAKRALPTRVAMRWASENEPTDPGLWAKVQALAKGEQKSMTHDGKTIEAPNDGAGFKVFPSAYANGWASKTYGDLGGGWSKKAGPSPMPATEDCDAMVSTAWVSPQGKMIFLRGQTHEGFAEKWALRNEPDLYAQIVEHGQTARPHASIWHRVMLDRGWLQLQGMSSIVVPPRPSRKQLQNVADFFANCIADGTSDPDRITLYILGLSPSLKGKPIEPGEDRYPFDVQERVSLADFIEREASGPVIEEMYQAMMERTRRASLIGAWDPTLREARGKAKKDVGHGGLDEWFSGHGGAKGKGEGATWGDWVAISPVTKTLDSGKKVEKGDIVGDCGISDDPDWKEITKGGKDPLKCMPRQKAHDMPKAERAEKAKAKQRAEKADSNRGKKPTMTPTFDKKKARLQRIQMKREASARLRAAWRGDRG